MGSKPSPKDAVPAQATLPKSGKKRKARQPTYSVGVEAHTSTAQAASPGQPHGVSVSEKTADKKKKEIGTTSEHSAAGIHAAPATLGALNHGDPSPCDRTTPIALPPSTTASKEPRRKSVRFSLKRNLVMTIGQPPLPEDVRTPPTSKPKGSALKQVSTIQRPGPATKSNLGSQAKKRKKKSKNSSEKDAVAAVKPVLATKRAGGTSTALKRTSHGLVPSPTSVRRPRAAEFF